MIEINSFAANYWWLAAAGLFILAGVFAFGKRKLRWVRISPHATSRAEGGATVGQPIERRHLEFMADVFAVRNIPGHLTVFTMVRKGSNETFRFVRTDETESGLPVWELATCWRDERLNSDGTPAEARRFQSRK